MTKKVDKDYYHKRVKRIGKLLSELTTDCGDGVTNLVTIESVAYRATALFTQLISVNPPEKLAEMKRYYIENISEILRNGLNAPLTRLNDDWRLRTPRTNKGLDK